MDENELQETIFRLNEVMREINDANRRGVDVSKELYKELENLKRKINESKKASDGLGGAFADLGRSALDLGRSMYRGEQGASVFADSVESAANVISQAILLIPGIGIAAKAATVAIGALAKAANLAAEQGDTLYESYVDLAKFGAATAGGLEQVFENVQKFGMGIEQLDQFTRMISENRRELSKFAPSVGEATEELGEISAGITSTNLRREFMMLGYTVPEINEAMVDYIALQSQVGMTQNRSTRQLTNSSAEYLKNVDALTRATGIQRDQLEENIRAARQEQQFRARMDRMRREDPDRALDIENAFAALAEDYPEHAKALKSMTGGVVATDDAIRLQARTGGRALQLVTDMMQDTISPIQFLEGVAESAVAGVERFGGLAERTSPAVFETILGNYAEMSNLASDEAFESLQERLEQIRREQRDTTEQRNTLLSSSIDLRISQMEARDALQAMVQDGVAPATAAMDGFAGVTRGVIDMIDAIPFIGREEADQAKGSAFLKGTRVTGRDTADEFSQAGSGISGSAMGTTPKVHDTKTSQVVAGLINEIKGSDGMTVRDLFSSPSDPEGNTAIRIVRGIPGLDIDTDLTGAHENHRVISALSQGYLGLLKHDEAPAGRQYRAEVAAAIARELGIDQSEVDSYRTGGISRGPDSGYLSMMHGTEAVVPLPDGDSIPVSLGGLGNITRSFDNLSGGFNNVINYIGDINNMTDTLVDGIESLSTDIAENTGNSENTEQSRTLNRNLREQIRSIQEQSGKLDSLIRVSQSNNNIMSKILQNSTA